MSANPKTNKKKTTNPTKYLHQYLADEDILSYPSFAHAWCEDACAVWLLSSAILGSAGLGEAFGRHGLIVFCVHLRYNTLTIDSTVKRVFILAKIF